MIAISLVTVNHDWWSGTVPGRVVWDRGTRAWQRKVVVRINVDFAALLGPPGFLDGPWVQVDGGLISVADVAAWPYSGLLCKIASFLGTLRIGLLILVILVITGFPNWSF